MRGNRHSVEVVLPTRDRLGESPLWNSADGTLHWVDFYGPVVRSLPRGASEPVTRSVAREGTIGSLALADHGRLVVALDQGLMLLDPATDELVAFADPNEGRDGVGYNDAKVDREGRLWIGTFDRSEKEPRGILYSVDGNGRAAVGDSGFAVCNGPAVSPDGRLLYFSDSVGRRILVYRIEERTGRLVDRRLFAEIGADAGLPDGLCTDSAGGLWCAHYGGARLTRFRGDGSIDRTIGLPVRNVTSCCLGGDELRTLYITTAEDTAADRPASGVGLEGALFAVEVEVAGLPEPVFRPLGGR